MSVLEIIKIDPNVWVTVTGPLDHLCPYRDEVDHGTVIITWYTGTSTYELHSISEYLNSFSDRKLSHEEITQEIQRELWASKVTTRWSTAGLAVEVTCGE